MKALNVVIAAAAGVVVGAAAGILLAPRRGSETREAIMDYLKAHCPKCKKQNLEVLADQIAEEIREA